MTKSKNVMTIWMLKLSRMECWMSKTTDSKEVYWQKKLKKKCFVCWGMGESWAVWVVVTWHRSPKAISFTRSIHGLQAKVRCQKPPKPIFCWGLWILRKQRANIWKGYVQTGIFKRESHFYEGHELRTPHTRLRTLQSWMAGNQQFQGGSGII